MCASDIAGCCVIGRLCIAVREWYCGLCCVICGLCVCVGCELLDVCAIVWECYGGLCVFVGDVIVDYGIIANWVGVSACVLIIVYEQYCKYNNNVSEVFTCTTPVIPVGIVIP